MPKRRKVLSAPVGFLPRNIATPVGRKKQSRWLWGALDHQTGQILAYVFGRREDQALLTLKALLEPFGMRRYYADGWGAYQRHLDPTHHVVGRRATQQLERKHLTLRTRIKRLVRKNHLLFQNCPHARYCDWAVLQPV
jgi:IS1 family transposase